MELFRPVLCPRPRPHAWLVSLAMALAASCGEGSGEAGMDAGHGDGHVGEIDGGLDDAATEDAGQDPVDAGQDPVDGSQGPMDGSQDPVDGGDDGDAAGPACEDHPCQYDISCPATDACDDICMGGCDVAPRSAQSCGELGWEAGHGTAKVCAESTIEGSCSGEVTFAEAEALCGGIGARLCTLPELLENETRGTGCWYDLELVWSATHCTGGGRALAAGSTLNHQGVQCADETEDTAVVRCCADADVDLVESACSEIDPDCIDALNEACTSDEGCAEVGPQCSEDRTKLEECVPQNPVADCLERTTRQSCSTGVGELCENDNACVFRCENVPCEYENASFGCANDPGGCGACGTGCTTTLPSAMTCAELGWAVNASGVCAASDVSSVNGGEMCSGLVNIVQADQLCRNMGARLCTADELLANATAGTGCGYDWERVWSTTMCDNSLHFTAAGNTAYAEEVPSSCEFGSDAIAVARCCADPERLIQVAHCRVQASCF
jgi:hypothetical protein